MKTLTLIFCALLVISCNPCRYVARHQECFLPDTVKEISVQTIHDTTTWIQADSFALSALFYCDSANNVLIKTLNEYKSKGVVTKIIYKNNRLEINLATDSIGVLNRIISNTGKTVIHDKNPVNAELQRQNIKKDKQLQRRKMIMLFSGGLNLLLIVLIVIYIWFKLK